MPEISQAERLKRAVEAVEKMHAKYKKLAVELKPLSDREKVLQKRFTELMEQHTRHIPLVSCGDMMPMLIEQAGKAGRLDELRDVFMDYIEISSASHKIEREMLHDYLDACPADLLQEAMQRKKELESKPLEDAAGYLLGRIIEWAIREWKLYQLEGGFQATKQAIAKERN